MYTYIQERCGILEDELRRFEAQREEDSRRLQQMTNLRAKDADQAHITFFFNDLFFFNVIRHTLKNKSQSTGTDD